MRIFGILLLALVAVSSCRNIKSTNAKPIETIHADTIILRQICGYCESVNARKKVANGKQCYCIDIFDPFDKEDSTKFEQFVSMIPNAKHLIIENPSASIDKIPFKDFESLETLYVFGNDYNTDWLSDFPKELLTLKNLKSIEFDGVKFKEENLKMIKQQYPHIKIIGKIAYF